MLVFYLSAALTRLLRFEPSEVARQSEASQGNIRAEDMVPVLRKRSGPTGELFCYFVAGWSDPSGDVTSKYYIVDGVEALQKFGQDAW